MSDFIEGVNKNGKKIFEIGDDVKVTDKDKKKEIDQIEEEQKDKDK